MEHLFEEINENDDDYYKPLLVGSFKEGFKLYESRGDKNKTLLLEQYLNKIMPYLKELINNYKAIKNGSREWKIQLVAHKNFVSFNTGVIIDFYVWTKNEEIRLGNETDDIVKNLINSFLNNHQKQQQVTKEKSNLVFECVELMSCQINKTSLKRGSSYIASPKWLANKKATINPKYTKCSQCFAYSIIVALNHQKIKNQPERLKNIAPFVDQYNWEDIDFPAEIKDWKKCEKNNETIAFNILQVPHGERNIIHVYKSKHNHTRKNQVVLLMITDGEKWYYTALKSEQTEDGFIYPTKSLSRLLRGIASNNKGDFHCLNCLHSFRTYNTLKKHEKLCENNDFCCVEMPCKKKRNDKILKYSDGMKALRMPFKIYADLECLLVKQQSCQNDPDKSYTERKAIHESCGYSLDLISSFGVKENKHKSIGVKTVLKSFVKRYKK